MDERIKKDVKIRLCKVVIVALIIYLSLLAISGISKAREEKILENGCPKCHCAYELDSYTYSKNIGYVYDYECPKCHNHIFTSVTLDENN